MISIQSLRVPHEHSLFMTVGYLGKLENPGADLSVMYQFLKKPI